MKTKPKDRAASVGCKGFLPPLTHPFRTYCMVPGKTHTHGLDLLQGGRSAAGHLPFLAADAARPPVPSSPEATFARRLLCAALWVALVGESRLPPC